MTFEFIRLLNSSNKQISLMNLEITLELKSIDLLHCSLNIARLQMTNVEEKVNVMTGVRKRSRVARLRKSVKAISPTIAVLLMIAIAVIAAIVVYLWIMGFLNFNDGL